MALLVFHDPSWDIEPTILMVCEPLVTTSSSKVTAIEVADVQLEVLEARTVEVDKVVPDARVDEPAGSMISMVLVWPYVNNARRSYKKKRHWKRYCLTIRQSCSGRDHCRIIERTGRRLEGDHR